MIKQVQKIKPEYSELKIIRSSCQNLFTVFTGLLVHKFFKGSKTVKIKSLICIVICFFDEIRQKMKKVYHRNKQRELGRMCQQKA